MAASLAALVAHSCFIRYSLSLVDIAYPHSIIMAIFDLILKLIMQAMPRVVPQSIGPYFVR